MTETNNYMVETHNLVKKFNDIVAVNNINLLVPKGSIYAFLGPNGAGKTTTIRMLLGIMQPTSGTILIDDKDIREDPRDIRGKMGFLPQVSAAYADLTPMQNIKFVVELNGIPFDSVQAKLDAYFAKLEFSRELLSKPFSKLSGGEQRAISFIMAAITDREFLILDEPTSGLDIARAKYIRSIIKEMVEEEGKTVLLSSHIVSDLEELATHCGIIKNGFLVFQGRKEEIIEEFAPETKIFEDAIVEAFKTDVFVKEGVVR
ncbi:MAG: ABC transporter ATP-binding protein [Candidatus Heimdallarchaeaceae archaeon]